MDKNNFENIALKYSEIVDKKPIHVYYERPNLLSLLPSDLKNLQVLDLGCGSGWYAEYLHHKGANVTAIDNSPTMVELTNQRLKNKIHTYLADLEKPLNILGDQEFDVIIAPLVVHYIKEWAPLFNQLAKKLKPKGVFVFSTHNPYVEYTLFDLTNYFEKVKIIDEWENVGKVEFYHHTLNELSEALSSSGFMIAKILEPQPLPLMQAVDAQLYKKLTTKPWFLFIKAIKV